MKDKTLDTPYIYFELKDDILLGTYKGAITLEIAKKTVETRLKFTEGKSYPVFGQGINVSAIDRDAREYFASAEAVKGIKAGAFYVESVFQSFLINFSFNIFTPIVPVKIFTDRQKAIKWLEQYK